MQIVKYFFYLHELFLNFCKKEGISQLDFLLGQKLGSGSNKKVGFD